MIETRFSIRELKAELGTISKDLQRRVVRQGVFAAGAVIRDLAKQYAPVREPQNSKFVPGTRQPVPPGLLKRSISVFGRRAPPGVVAVRVVPKAGRRAMKGKGSSYLRDAYYWPWVEAGHVIAPRRGIRGGARTKALQRHRLRAAKRFVEARPYLAPALRMGSRRAVDRFEEQIEKALARYR